MDDEYLPVITEEEIELINYLQDGTPSSILYERYGDKRKFYYRKDKIFNRFDVKNKFSIIYEKLDLTRFLILSKFRFKSPYLVQYLPYYKPQVHYMSQFVIPPTFEHEFIEGIIRLDKEVTIYQAKELGPAHYSFKNFHPEVTHEDRFFRWMALLIDKKIPDLKLPDHTPFEFDTHMLQLLHHIVKGISREEIIKEMNLTRGREYDTPVKKMEDVFYKRVLFINRIPRFLYIIEKSPSKFSLGTLVNSFIELFVFCHPFQIKKYYPEPINRMDYGIFCILTPPTPNIPFFHHSIDKFLKVNSNLFLVEEGNDLFNLDQVYNEKVKNWLWSENIIEIVE
ncbi:MAG: hypothetical protein ACFFCM_09255 [Promethearchaeota archaeon]